MVTSPPPRGFARFGSEPDETRRTGMQAKTTHRKRNVVRLGGAVVAWFLLVVAGLLEVGWSIGMKYSEGFTRPVPSVLTGAGIVASMVLLSYAARSLPIGTAYGVWVGIGAAGAAVLGMVVLGEPVTAARIFFVCLLLVAVVGLKATSG
ncbi:quaternary ammonium compound-resistance protein SugE [Streptomyces sp. PsTaAH-130]|nr:quaternary ammonium compound-resistance protein SugE [Streptomyces sp. PsTaAH-130]